VRKLRIGAVALAPTLVSAQPAVRDTTVAVPHDVLGRERMATAARGHVPRRPCSRTDETKVIQIHAPSHPARSFESHGLRQRTPACRVEPTTRNYDRTARDPDTAAGGVAANGLVTMREKPQPHGLMVCSRQPYAG
jgi:hypothetical protein